MESIKINCYECKFTKLIEKNIIKHIPKKYYLPPEIWSEILNYYTLYKCNLCNNNICENHLLRCFNNSGYYKVHQKRFLESKYICNDCFYENL
jgi:hypothetical protein|uniref:Uncharacterized protein n=1 Tax=Mimiviridae sp. ChoanoV1 TaxID=2596887 RepID=A0A5B8IFL0_9VIRU|nr:hypothetical protein 4_68 [Mimiviridae sp. ChoanoV1]